MLTYSYTSVHIGLCQTKADHVYLRAHVHEVIPVKLLKKGNVSYGKTNSMASMSS